MGLSAHSRAASIGDLVFRDLTGDGVFQAGFGEAGISSVTLTLIGPGLDGELGTGDDTLVASETTNASGTYIFNSIPAGSYLLDVDKATLPEGFGLTSGTLPLGLTVAESDIITTADFGFDTVLCDTGIDFETDAQGNPLAEGQIIDDEWVTSGIVFSTNDPIAHPLMIFNSSDPTGNDVVTGKPDFDLGSPNEDFGGPGIGVGGEFGAPGQNARAHEQILIISDDGISANPNDYRFGGSVIMDFTSSTFVQDVQLLDMEVASGEAATVILARNADGDVISTTPVPLLGDNSFQVVELNDLGVRQLEIVLGGSGGLAQVCFELDPQGQIGGLIFNDRNGNGLFDPGEGEDGLSSVTLNLIYDGEVLTSTTTASDGTYNFEGLPAGDFTVDVVEDTLPPGFILTTDNEPLDITLAKDQVVDDADIGYREAPVSINGLVFDDANGDGIFNELDGDAGLPGVVVFIVSFENDLITSRTTDSNGQFSADELPAGEYILDVAEATLPFGATLTTGNEPLGLTLAPGESADVEFGYAITEVQPGSVFGTVFDDENLNGLLDIDEDGISTVTVTLVSVDGGSSQSIVTDGAGNYIFSELPPGTYQIFVEQGTLPPGSLPTTPPVLVFTLGENESANIDFGFAQFNLTGAVNGFVFGDVNGNGILDLGETGIEGVELTLINLSNATTTSAVTDANGFYLFLNLTPGSYRIDVNESSLPLNLNASTTPEPRDVTVSAGVAVRADFGYQQSNSTIFGVVFQDLNNDGDYDPDFGNFGEPGIQSVDVVLTDLDSGASATVTTNLEGEYNFIGLAPGNYRVDVVDQTLPQGLISTSGNDPSDITLAANEDLEINFGYAQEDVEPGAIGDLVFFDEDGDGIFERLDGESGLEGVTVFLLLGDQVIDAQITNSNGFYKFRDLEPGNYQVDVDESTLPDGFTLTTGNEPLEITLGAGEGISTADFGYWDGDVDFKTWYFAEGDLRNDYETWILVVNPSDTAAEVELTVLFEDREPFTTTRSIAPTTRFTFDMEKVFEDNELEPGAFAAVLKAVNGVQVFAERAMYWPVEGVVRAGGTSSVGSQGLSGRWYMAEATTTLEREAFILIGNPNRDSAQVRVDFLLQGEPARTKFYTVPANRRFTIDVDEFLPSQNFSTRITSTNGVPLIVERTLYGPANGQLRKWGHSAAGVVEAQPHWYLAEGATHSSFVTFLLIGNPNPEPVTVNLRFLLDNGDPVDKQVVVQGDSRFTVNVELMFPDDMTDITGFASEVWSEGGEDIVVERAFYFSTEGFTDRSVGTGVLGAHELRPRWLLPEGAINGPSGFEAFVLIGNPSDTAANVTVSLVQSNGEVVPVDIVVGPKQRQTVNVNTILPDTGGTTSFSALVESTNGVGIIVERTMYWSTVPGVTRYEGHGSMGVGLEFEEMDPAALSFFESK